MMERSGPNTHIRTHIYVLIEWLTDTFSHHDEADEDGCYARVHVNIGTWHSPAFGLSDSLHYKCKSTIKVPLRNVAMWQGLCPLHVEKLKCRARPCYTKLQNRESK